MPVPTNPERLKGDFDRGACARCGITQDVPQQTLHTVGGEQGDRGDSGMPPDQVRADGDTESSGRWLGVPADHVILQRK